MAKTYKKIDDDTLEMTTTHTQKVKKADLEMEKEMFEGEIECAKERIAEIDEKLDKLK